MARDVMSGAASTHESMVGAASLGSIDLAASTILRGDHTAPTRLAILLQERLGAVKNHVRSIDPTI